MIGWPLGLDHRAGKTRDGGRADMARHLDGPDEYGPRVVALVGIQRIPVERANRRNA
jgi:hypothetical protein